MEQFAFRTKERRVPQSIQTIDHRGYLSHYFKRGINGKQLSFYDIRIAKVVLRSFIHPWFIIFHCFYIADELYRG